MEELITQPGNEKASVRFRAVNALGQFGNQQSVQVIKRALEGEEGQAAKFENWSVGKRNFDYLLNRLERRSAAGKAHRMEAIAIVNDRAGSITLAALFPEPGATASICSKRAL